MSPLGYLHPAYAAAMALEGSVVTLAKSGGALVVRRIPGTNLQDAMAPYPFLVCRDWGRLSEDLEGLDGGLVSLTAVIDPLGAVSERLLRASFGQLLRPFKEHFIVDLSQPATAFVDPHHQGCARRALKKVAVERCEAPLDHLADWLHLYATLVRRHDIRGPARMTEESLRLQFGVPGFSMFRACRDGVTIGMILCMEHGENAYFHLGAYSELGYRSKASYALVWSIIEHFARTGVKTLNIGAGAGAFGKGGDGLAAFKRGWANGRRLTYLAGSILDHHSYRTLSAAVGSDTGGYFPAYRAGEFD